MMQLLAVDGMLRVLGAECCCWASPAAVLLLLLLQMPSFDVCCFAVLSMTLYAA
jgi:hypothetical protein